MNIGKRRVDAVAYIVLGLGALLILFPMYITVVTTFKTMQESNGKLQQTINAVNEKNNEYSRKLAESENTCRQLRAELSSSKSGGIYRGLFIATAVILVIVVIALLAR